MKLDMILIIGLIVNTLFAVLYPAQIFGDDPLGISGIKQEKLIQYYSVNGSGIINGYDPTTGQIRNNDDLFTEFDSAVTSTDGDAGVLTTEVFGWIDWVKVGFNLLKTLFMFIVGFIFMMWQLVYPLNFLIGIPFSLMYMFAISSFIIGRS